MPLFRFHKGGLQESLDTTVIVNNIEELRKAIKDRHKGFLQEEKDFFGIIIGDYPTKEHCFDRRIGWYTQMVTSDILERGVFVPEGFLSEPLIKL